MVSTIRAPKDAMSITTLNDIFFAAVERNLDRMLLYREAGKWLPITSRDFGRSVARTARALHTWGIRPGDRIAILSENRPEWPMADIASLLLGAVTVPLYTTLTAEQTAFVLNDSACRTVFLSSDQQLHKILSILPQTQIEKIVVMDPVEFNGDLAPFAGKCVTMNQITLQGPEDLGREIEAKARSIGPHDLATIVYTSGTTGTSKGAMLTHGNIASNIQCSLLGFNMRPGLISISFLPLCHITARHVDFAMLYHGVTLAYCPFLDRLPASLMEVQPSVFVAVPRVYEKIYAQAAQKAKAQPKRAIFEWALSVGKHNKREILAGRTPTSRSWKLANKLVFSKIRQGMGGRVETFISGGAPLGRELAEWYADAGIRIHEGYGLTETSPVIAVNTPLNHRIGTVGKTLPNLEVRIAEDGEILVRGPSVFQGYWNRPEETKARFSRWLVQDGRHRQYRCRWISLRHGSQKGSHQDVRGEVHCAAAHREFSKAESSGRNRGHPRRPPQVSHGSVSPNFVALETGRRKTDLPFTSRAELVANPKVQALYEGIVEGVNGNLARFEKMKRVLVVAEEFTPENGAMTPTMKLRRKVIEDRYRRQIDDLYAQAEATVTQS